MKFMQEYGEQKGRPMGFGDNQVSTDDPFGACLERLAFYMSVGTVFNEESRATDKVSITVYEKPDNWRELEAKHQPVERKPLATVLYDKHGLREVKPPQLIA